MTVRTNTAEGQPDGTTVTTGNSGGASGDAFLSVDPGAGNSITFSTEQAMHGTRSYKFITPAAQPNSVLLLDGATSANFSVRFYLRLTGTPASAIIFPCVVQTAAGATVCRLHLNTSRQLVIVNAAGSGVATFTAALSLNTWYRIALFGTNGVSGSVTCKLYAGDSLTAVETQGPHTANLGTVDAARGVYGSVSTETPGDFYIDSIEQNMQSATEIGPVAGGSNTPPTANAGSDQNVDPWDTVTLNGSGSSDSDGTIASYVWTQTGGTPTVALSGSGHSRTFEAPGTIGGTSLTFELEVTDDDGDSDTDTVVVNVSTGDLFYFDGTWKGVRLDEL